MYTIAMTTPLLGGFYYSGLLRAIQRQAVRLGVHLIALRTGSRRQYDLPFAIDQADGWLLVLDSTSSDFCAALCASGKPVASIAHEVNDARVTTIRSDNRAGIREAMLALYRAGHRRFGFLGYVVESDICERLAAFREFLAEHALPADDAPVVYSGGYTVDAGRVAAKTFVELDRRPTALITSNDQNAAGAIDCLLRAGLRVPEDVAVVGFDNSPLARARRPLIASIDQDFDALAHAAISTLLARLNGAAWPRQVVVQSHFIARESAGVCAPAPDGVAAVALDQFADMILTSDEISPFLHAGAMGEVPALLRQIAENARWAVFAQPDPVTDRLVLRHAVAEGGSAYPVDKVAPTLEIRRFPVIEGIDLFKPLAGDFIAALPLWVDRKLCGVIALCIGETGLAQDIARLMLMHNLELTTTGLERAIQNERLEERVHERTEELRAVNKELGDALRILSATQSDLIQAEKMASLGSLVAGVAHELNTPIGNSLLVAGSIDNEVRKLETALASGTLRRSTLEQRLHFLEEGALVLSRNMQIASELIARFKQVAVLQSGQKRRKFDLRVTLAEVLATFKSALRPSPYGLDLAVESGLELESYPIPFGQVIISLLENAQIHGFAGSETGTVTVSARRQEGGLVEVSIADDGCGISAELLPQVFEPFFTTRRQEGAGLGLHIAYNIVTGLLGGRLSVESDAGRGTRFVMLLPVCAPKEAPGKPRSAA